MKSCVPASPLHQSLSVLLAALVALLSLAFVAAAQYARVLDTTAQPANVPRGRGPFPGSDSGNAAHAPGFPIQIEFSFPDPILRSDDSTLVDFVLTNVGTAPVQLPAATKPSKASIFVLTLWLTSDAIAKPVFVDRTTQQPVTIAAVTTSAELFGDPAHPETSITLNPGERLLVHSASRVHLQAGQHQFTSHAELIKVVQDGGIRSLGLGWTDSAPLTAQLAPPSH